MARKKRAKKASKKGSKKVAKKTSKTSKKVGKKTGKTTGKRKTTVKSLVKKPVRELEALALKVDKALTIKENDMRQAERRRYGKGGRVSGPVYNPKAIRAGERSRIISMYEGGVGSGI